LSTSTGFSDFPFTAISPWTTIMMNTVNMFNAIQHILWIGSCGHA
jgi:hypothetical protein